MSWEKIQINIHMGEVEICDQPPKLLKYRCTNTVLGEGDSHLNFTLVKEYEGAVQTS